MNCKRHVFLYTLLVVATLLWASVSLAAEPVAIKVMLRGDNAQREAFAKAIVPAFEAKYPNIHVIWEPAVTGWQDKMIVNYSAGLTPDVTEMYSTYSQEWADAGMMLDLRPFIKRDIPDKEIRDFFPQIWNSGTLFHGAHKGIMYGVPRYVNLGGTLAYNTNMIDSAGLERMETVDAQGRWNWDAFRQYLLKLTQKGPDGSVKQWGMSSPNTAWAKTLYAAGGRFFNYPANPFEYMLNRPESVLGLEYWQQLYTIDKTIWHGWWTKFEQGQAAMDMTGSEPYGKWGTEVIGDKFEWNLAPLPMGPDNRGASTAKDQYGILSTTKHPEEAWAFVKFCISPEGQRIMMVSSGAMPIRISLLGEFSKMLPGKNVKYMADAAYVAHIDQKAVMIESTKIMPLINTAITASVFRQQKSVKLAMDEIAPQIEAILKNVKR